MGLGAASSGRTLAAAASLLLLAGWGSGARAAGTVTITGQIAGPTPFIQYLTASVSGGTIANVGFSIAPKAGSFTRPITATASAAYLAAHGALNGSFLAVPVFGLYAGSANTVQLAFGFTDGSTQQMTVPVTAPSYTDPCGSMNTPTVTNNRTATGDLDFDYFVVKDLCSPNAPAIFDTDGNIRWVGFSNVTAIASAFYGNGIYETDGKTGINRLDLWGNLSKIAEFGASYGATSTNTHNIDTGRDGLIVDVDTASNYEADAIEFDGTTGKTLNSWNMAAIFGAAMRAGGDDPSGFVVSDGKTDWFHMNAVTYSPADNTLIVSSRENFVVDVDYDTPADGVKKIHWILGDSTKKWAQYPSLARYALSLGSGTPAPIGQHAVSIDGAGDLLLFNDGNGSTTFSPPGMTPGYSTANSYHIDTAARTATGVFSYRPNPSLYSPFCGSAYEAAPSSHLIDFATAGPYTSATIQGLGANNRLVFQLVLPQGSETCGPGWNASPLPNMAPQY